MGGLAKGFSNIGHSAMSIAHGKANLRDIINVSPVGAAGQLIGGVVGIDGNKVMTMPGKGGGAGPGAALQAGQADTPATALAMSGGAPLLANIAMGASVEDTLAGYFGQGNYKEFYDGLDDASKKLVDGVKNQLTEIQSNTNLRNQAVQQVVNDFPNIAKQAAQAQTDAKQAAGEEFDSTTKAYINQALQGTAAKYAANGGLSSGAMDAATARVGAEAGMQKLSYVTDQGDNAYTRTYSNAASNWQARYNEVNALRQFQNTMTQGAAGNGFSAVQNMLGRTTQTNLANAGYGNTQQLANQKYAYQDSQNSQEANAALFGTIGKVGGSVIGGIYGGPAGAAIGGSLGGAAGSYAGGKIGGGNY